MDASHELILLGGALGLLSIFAGLAFARIGAPLLLVFLVLGMLAGEDGPGGIQFDDFRSAYLIGSIALAVILFQGGLQTTRAMLRSAFWPALAMATVGVVVTATLVGLMLAWVSGTGLTDALLIGAVAAPTDAAAVISLLRLSKTRVPERVVSLLEVESGLNDPAAVFLTLVLVGQVIHPGASSLWDGARLFLEEMGGGALAGIGGGLLMVALLRRPPISAALAPVFALTAALALFGGAQSLHTSGFLAVYIAGIITGSASHPARAAVGQFFDAFGWLAQIVLFLMLGLLVTPHDLAPLIPASLAAALVLIFVARPVAAFACLMPLGFSVRETGFAAWVGLRGAVPIYLTVIPVLAGARDATMLFGVAFVVVIVSLIVQGWTIGPVARLLGFGAPRI